MATTLKDNEGVYFVPALVGLGAPYWDQSARGAFFGITRGTKREHFIRAALEAMAYQTKDIVISMEKDSGLKAKDLKVDGGAAANNLLCQFQSDILGIKVIRPKITETTSAGAAYLAGLGVGFWKDSKEIKKFWAKDSEFSPKMANADSSRLYSGWQDAVNRTISNK